MKSFRTYAKAFHPPSGLALQIIKNCLHFQYYEKVTSRTITLSRNNYKMTLNIALV